MWKTLGWVFALHQQMAMSQPGPGRSVFLSSRQCQAAGGYIVLKNVMNLLQCEGITRSMTGAMATSRNCLLWHRTLNCHLIHLCGETGMGDFHSRYVSVLELSLWLLSCLPQNPFQDDCIHLGSFRCSSGISLCPVSQVQCLRGHLGFSS